MTQESTKITDLPAVTTSLSDPEARKKLKTSLATITKYYKEIADLKDGASDTIGDVAKQYGLDKKIVRKMAMTMHKANYGSLLEENQRFEQLYETVVEGQLRV